MNLEARCIYIAVRNRTPNGGHPMELTLKASASRTISVVILAAALGLSPAAYGGQEAKNQALPGAMPVAQQNALVQKYCAGCHDDAHRNGGLSLQHFDASQVEPSL